MNEGDVAPRLSKRDLKHQKFQGEVGPILLIVVPAVAIRRVYIFVTWQDVRTEC
jgi:hypothetical protein